MNKQEWIAECRYINDPVNINTRGGYTYEQVMNNKNCSKDVKYWHNISGTDRFLFKSKLAESWEFFDEDIENPIRNTNQIYLRFLDISPFIESANHYRQHKKYIFAARNDMRYNKYWEDEEYKCRNGLEIEGIYITGRYYFLINFGLFKAIPVDKDGNKLGNTKKNTLLRFIDLQYYLSHEIEEVLLSGKYSNQREYLDWFPLKKIDDFLELKFEFFAAAKGRRKGWSAFIGIAVIAYNFTFIANSKSLIGAGEKAHYGPILRGIHETRNALDKNTAWVRVTEILDQKEHFISGIKTKDEHGTPITEGYKSEVEAVSFSDSFRGIGDSADIINIEEPGKFGNLIETLKVSIEPLLREGNFPIGACVLGGTAGDMDSGGSVGLEEIMYNPEPHGFKSYDNIYEKSPTNSKSGWFIDDLWFLSETLNKKSLLALDNSERNKKLLNKIKGDFVDVVDKHGNSYRYWANLILEKKRALSKKTSAAAYQKFITQQPKYLTEAFLVNEMSPFDTALAQEALGQLKIKESKLPIEKGSFTILNQTNGVAEIKWQMDTNLQFIDRFPWEDHDTEGCWVIYSHPVITHKHIREDIRRGNDEAKSNFIQSWRYIAGNDPIDWGSGETADSGSNKHSLAVTYILDTYTRQIVAEYVSRPYKADDYFEQLWRGLEYYNATLNYESNLKGLFTYFRSKNKLYLLTDELQSLKDKFGGKPSRNAIKGTRANERVNKAAREAIHSWTTEMVALDQDQETGELVEVPRMYTIPSIALLQEIIKWSIKGNFDRVSGLGMALLLLNDRNYEIDAITDTIEERFSSGVFSRIKQKLDKIETYEDFRTRR